MTAAIASPTNPVGITIRHAEPSRARLPDVDEVAAMRLMTGLLVVTLLVSPACRKAEAPPPADASHAAHPAGTPAARTTLLGNLGSYQRAITTANA